MSITLFKSDLERICRGESKRFTLEGPPTVCKGPGDWLIHSFTFRDKSGRLYRTKAFSIHEVWESDYEHDDAVFFVQ